MPSILMYLVIFFFNFTSLLKILSYIITNINTSMETHTQKSDKTIPNLRFWFLSLAAETVVGDFLKFLYVPRIYSLSLLLFDHVFL